MPGADISTTLERLDERSRATFEKLEAMEKRYDAFHEEIREEMREASRSLSERITRLEVDIDIIKNKNSYEDGKRSGIVWAGGVAIASFSAIFGALGNMIYSWAVGPHGPLR